MVKLAQKKKERFNPKIIFNSKFNKFGNKNIENKYLKTIE